jgi:hypothetical protein
MFKPVLAPILAIAATAMLAVSALAAGAPGSQHVRLTAPQQCFDKGPYTICVTSKGEMTTVQTPSGNLSFSVNVTSAFSVTTLGTPVASGTSSVHEHDLYTNNFATLQEIGIHDTSTQVAGGQTCTFTEDFHATNLDLYTGTGNIQYESVSFVCV